MQIAEDHVAFAVVPKRAPQQPLGESHSSASSPFQRRIRARREAFNARTAADTGVVQASMLPNARINPLFYATVHATEEAILNSLFRATTTTGNGMNIAASR